MKKLKLFGLILCLIVLGVAGTCDYREAIIHSLTQEQYMRILQELGGTASDKEIVEKYHENRIYYDSIK